MVSTRVVVSLGTFVVFLALGMGWLQSTADPTVVFTSFGIFAVVGSAVGSCHCPPTNDTSSGSIMVALLPYLVPPGSLSPGIILLPIAFLVCLASFFRLKLALLGGLLCVGDGVLWLVATTLIPKAVGITFSFGPFTAILGGGILLGSYILDKFERLDLSEDLRFD